MEEVCWEVGLDDWVELSSPQTSCRVGWLVGVAWLVGVVSAGQGVGKVAEEQWACCSVSLSPWQPLVSVEVSGGWGCGRGLEQGSERERWRWGSCEVWG